MASITELRAQLQGLAPPATAAVLVPLVQTQRGPVLLYEVRSGAVRQPGEICFPGGRVELGENPVDTALRETWEEMSIAPQHITLTGLLPLDTLAGGRRVQPVVAKLSPEALASVRLSEAEVAEWFTVPLAWLQANPAQWYDYTPGSTGGETPLILQGFLQHYSRALRTRYWEYESHGIWGLTARITQSLLEHISEKKIEVL